LERKKVGARLLLCEWCFKSLVQNRLADRAGNRGNLRWIGKKGRRTRVELGKRTAHETFCLSKRQLVGAECLGFTTKRRRWEGGGDCRENGASKRIKDLVRLDQTRLHLPLQKFCDPAIRHGPVYGGREPETSGTKYEQDNPASEGRGGPNWPVSFRSRRLLTIGGG